jgi:hypothetical protein
MPQPTRPRTYPHPTLARLPPPQSDPQSTQSAGPVRFLIFCSISIFLLASLVAGTVEDPSVILVQSSRECTFIIPIHWNIKSAPASPGRSRVGPALYVFSLLGLTPLPCSPCPPSTQDYQSVVNHYPRPREYTTNTDGGRRDSGKMWLQHPGELCSNDSPGREGNGWL